MPVTAPAPENIYTVTRLNREVREALEGLFPMIWVQGELSNLARPASGHMYFSLKDSAAQVRCAMFKNRQSGLRFSPENGMQVIARANIGLYEGRGEYQLIIESLELAGAGALQVAFEALKAKLSKEGLFDEQHKQPIPAFPATIGIITSATGAAVHDIVSTLARRYPLAGIIVYPVPVQGEGAGEKIAAMIALANQRAECDVLITARGGGSLEDLWAFNEEPVARAIFASNLPIVNGVGHEIDFTIADFVADQRAATPSVAAELVSPDAHKLSMQLQRHSDQIIRLQRQVLTDYQKHMVYLSKRLVDPKQRLQQLTQQIDEYGLRIHHVMEKLFVHQKAMLARLADRMDKQNPAGKIKRQSERVNHVQSQLKKTIMATVRQARQKLFTLEQLLKTVSPVATLERGYAIVTEPGSGNIVRETRRLKVGDPLRIQLAKGKIDSKIDRIHEK